MKITIRRDKRLVRCPMCWESYPPYLTVWSYSHSKHKKLSGEYKVVPCLMRVCSDCYNGLTWLNDGTIQCVSCGRFEPSSKGNFFKIDGSSAFLCRECLNLMDDDSPKFAFDFVAECDQCGRQYRVEDVSTYKKSFDDYSFCICESCRFENIEALRQLREAGSLEGDE